MKDSDRRSYEMLVRVRDFGTTHAASFAPESLAAQLFATLNNKVSQLDTHTARQQTGMNTSAQRTSGRAAARYALVEDLEAISRTARVLALTSPGLDDKFRLPRRNRNDQSLLSTARSFAAEALPLKEQFISLEMPANFIQDLNADIEAFEESITGQNTSRETHVAATSAIDEAIDEGINIARQLDAIVRNKFANDVATLAAWTSARHVERAPRRKSGAEAEAGTKTGAEAAPSPVV